MIGLNILHFAVVVNLKLSLQVVKVGPSLVSSDGFGHLIRKYFNSCQVPSIYLLNLYDPEPCKGESEVVDIIDLGLLMHLIAGNNIRFLNLKQSSKPRQPINRLNLILILSLINLSGKTNQIIIILCLIKQKIR